MSPVQTPRRAAIRCSSLVLRLTVGLALTASVVLGTSGATTPVAEANSEAIGTGIGDTVPVAAGGKAHTCALSSTGAVNCWGRNDEGQLGNGNTTSSARPVTVNLPTGTTAIAISAGDAHTCAVLNDGRAACWGRNTSGQLGNGGTANTSTPVIVALPDPGTAVGITVGAAFTCALLSTGDVNCWGDNTYRQLGNSTVTGPNSTTPVEVSLPAGTTTAISSGVSHVCALSNIGVVRCWGFNDAGQTGNSDLQNSATPFTVALPAGTAAVDVASGDFHTCAIVSTGALYCWGDNDEEQLGNNTPGDSATPVLVGGLPSDRTVTAVAGGEFHTCAVLDTGATWCWGRNTDGQLGNGATSNSNIPVAVTTTSGATATSIAAGEGHTCALLNDGSVSCWGRNGSGQLGNGGTTNSSTPVTVDLAVVANGAVAVTVGNSHACALLAASTVTCWGSNSFGELGNGTTTNSPVPVAVALRPGTTAIAITAGNAFTCALLNNGGVDCWGINGLGQLGNDTTTNSATPTPVPVSLPLGATATAVAAGNAHTCALLKSGSVACWGINSNGQLGNNSTTNSPAPVAVQLPTGRTATAIAAGSFQTCATLDTGVLHCWGNNAAGQLGNGSTTSPTVTPTPVSLPAGDAAIAISAGGLFHACAVGSVGRARCWGSNQDGQLGVGTPSFSTTPVDVALPSGTEATAITAGGSHTCALSNAGTAYCWGFNFSGQLGDGSNTNSPMPVAVALPAGTTATALSGGTNSTCALTNRGTVLCWGFNSSGQLGSGSFRNSSVPVSVGVPAAASSVIASAPNQQEASLMWTPGPASAFGAVTGWRVEQSTDNGTTWSPATTAVDSTTSTATTATVTGLTNGTTYRFRVAAINTVGTGPFAQSNTVTPTTAPTVTVTAAAGQADPTNTSPITFTATFDQTVTGLDTSDLTIAGTATTGTPTITDTTTSGGPSTYTITIPATSNGTITLAINADAATNTNNQPNATSNTATITYDTTGPVINTPTGGIQATTEPGKPGATITYTVTANDPTTPPQTLTLHDPAASALHTAALVASLNCTPASGSFFPIGTTTVTCTATDTANNTSTAAFAVTITDNEAPVITGQDQRVELPTNSTSGPITYRLPTATDNSGTATITCTPPPGTTFNAGPTTITCTATDPSTNTTTATYTITALTSTTPPPANTTPANTTPANTTPTATTPPITVPDGGLPATGTNPNSILLTALALLTLGALTTLSTRRHRKHPT